MRVVLSDREQLVDSDSIMPGAALCFASETRERAHGFEEDLLGGVFGVGAAMKHSDGEAKKPRKVAGAQELR